LGSECASRRLHGRPNFRPPDAPAATRYTETDLPGDRVAPGSAGEYSVSRRGRTCLRNGGPCSIPIRSIAGARAIADSPNLTAAEAACGSRAKTWRRRSALLYPQVDGTLGATREKITGASFGQPGAGATIFNLYNASVNVSYALDVAGRNRRELEALHSLVDYQEYQLAGAHLALTSNVVTAAIREASLRAQIDSTREIINAQNQSLDLVRRQFELGAVGRLNLVAQQAQAAQTEALLPPLERELAQTRHQLAALAGRVPSDGGIPTFELAALTLPQDLPLSLPSALARHGPDIRAAEALLPPPAHRSGRRRTSIRRST
jgi:outer membrane protein TolC